MANSRSTAALIAITALLALWSTASSALEAPEGRVILTVGGDIGTTNRGDQAVFDAEMLAELEGRRLETETPWHDGPKTFSGPLARAVLDAVDAQGVQITATALNDYGAEIPVDDLRDYDVILATHKDGERMSVRERGPIFVIYSFDSHPELHRETIYGRSVWQVNRLHVE
ncbi:oxidoreductase [Spiribacter vilamensis]|uniref:Oxidoreductase molybdopterin-binding domain-containing protein n=1 Tax=Spiribacter vilamensis TaxID=531306 RepID=A0A4Q8CZA8_9GAMM|nr:oxidoreductase [Spiribacter vilamensis]RZU98267.1 hypothetical protein EV698_0511 [Spiribacter vilamensis]